MRESRENEVRTSMGLGKKWAYPIGLIIVLASEFILRDVFLPRQASDIHVGIALVGEWLVLLVLLGFWIPRVEGKNLRSIGWTRLKKRHLWLGVLAYLLVMGATVLSGFALQSIGLKAIRSLQPMIKEYHPLTLIGLFLTGTFLEEIFYRGYLIERLISLTRKRWLAATASWLAFTLVHLKFFGLGPTIDVSILSAAFVLLYLKERSIWPCVVLHGINDVFGFLIFPLLIT
jgi:membrane protease YdiL (CAAX protease family)